MTSGDGTAVWPEQVRINAYAGDVVAPGSTARSAATGAVSPLGPAARGWILRHPLQDIAHDVDLVLAADDPPDLRRWMDPDVGWGIVLPATAAPVADQAGLLDAAASVRQLATDRAGPDGPVVFRYTPDDDPGVLRRVYADGTFQRIAVTGGARGSARGRMPWYLLLLGSPQVLPWTLQYRLNLSARVGRLDLEPAALDRYVAALQDDWAGSAASSTHPVVWAPELDDITELMRIALAVPLARHLQDDQQTAAGATCLSGAAATVAALDTALAANRPAVVVTTSHGRTGPLDDLEAMGRSLGLLVDSARSVLDPTALLATWPPDGVVWYAHACCSAGSDATSRYLGLVDATSEVGRTLAGVAALGARVAPLPTALLSAEKPARAFIGHVEPTFDWTLERPDTSQRLATAVLRAVWTGFFMAHPEPVGMAFADQFAAAAQLFGESAEDSRNSLAGSPARVSATASLLAAFDRQATVILGDPTVAPPALPPA